MRFGIALPGSGPLAGDSAVAATARAAEQLDYASVWSTLLRQLLVVTAHAERMPVGLLIPPGDGSPSGATHSASGDADPPALARRLGSRLRYVGARPPEHAAIRRQLPGAVLLDTSDRPPTPAAGGGGDVDGWSPSPGAGGDLFAQWRPAGSSLLLVLRLAGATPGQVDPAHLRAAIDARADEVVVTFSGARSLDEQLAGFADVAEQVAALAQPAG